MGITQSHTLSKDRLIVMLVVWYSSGITLNSNNLFLFLQPVTHVIARNLASTIYSGKPIVLGISLKDDSPAVMKTLQEVLKDYRH